jgi:predicted nucleotidyltransferase
MKHMPGEVLEEIVQRLVQGLRPEKIILFGSHAYGEPTEASDIDLLIVVSDSDQPRYRRARKAYECLWGLTAPTELIVLTRKELEMAAHVPTSLGYQALRRGRVLYG